MFIIYVYCISVSHYKLTDVCWRMNQLRQFEMNYETS